MEELQTKLQPELQTVVNLYLQGHTKEAISILSKLLDKEPQNERAWLLAVEMFNEKEKKIAILKRALGIFPSSSVLLQKLAQVKNTDYLPVLTKYAGLECYIASVYQIDGRNREVHFPREEVSAVLAAAIYSIANQRELLPEERSIVFEWATASFNAVNENKIDPNLTHIEVRAIDNIGRVVGHARFILTLLAVHAAVHRFPVIQEIGNEGPKVFEPVWPEAEWVIKPSAN